MNDRRVVLYTKMARVSALSQGLVEVYKQEGNELLVHLAVNVDERGSEEHDFVALVRFEQLHTLLCAVVVVVV